MSTSSEMIRPLDERDTVDVGSHIANFQAHFRMNTDITAIPLDADLKRPDSFDDGITDPYDRGLPMYIVAACLADTERLIPTGLAMIEDARDKAASGIMEPKIIDAGSGSGVLSYLADRIYTAEGLRPQITAVEIEQNIFDVGRLVLEASDVSSVEFVRGDARREIATFGKEFVLDTVISENLYTGLAEEHQVAIVRNLLDRYGIQSTDGSVRTTFIPKGVDLAVYLGFSGAPMDTRDDRSSRSIRIDRRSTSSESRTFDFSKIEEWEDRLFETIELVGKVTASAATHTVINGIVLEMSTRMGNHPTTHLRPNQTSTLGNDHFLAIPTELLPQGADRLVEVRYESGGPIQERTTHLN